MKQLLVFGIVFWVGDRVLNQILDEIKPNRLNSKFMFPYIGRSYK